MNAIYGTAENGERLSVSFGAFTGTAGIRQREGGLEVAYYGDPPRLIGPDGLAGTIDGADVIATATIATRLRGFTILWVPDAV